MKALDLTVVIPVRNEEDRLAKCLQCIGDLAPVLVVDSNSTDDTVRIAREHGAGVVNFDWNGKYPKKKNWVLVNELVDSEWILFLDADEYVTPAIKEELARVLPNTMNNGFWLNYEDLFMGKRLKFGIRSRKLFLMRKGKAQFQRVDDDGWTDMDMEIHEHLEVNGTVGNIKSRILHDSYRELSQHISKHNRYSTWEARRHMHRAGRESQTRRQWLKHKLVGSWFLGPLYFLADYVLYLGFLNGKAGFIRALLKAAYFLEIKIKIEELKASSSSGSQGTSTKRGNSLTTGQRDAE